MIKLQLIQSLGFGKNSQKDRSVHTFVYLCRDGENEELRYSIRSVEKFYPDARVILVGGKPSWYIGEYIHSPQNNARFDNVANSLSVIAQSDTIPEDIIIMNDDFFIREYVDKFECYTAGTLQNKILSYHLNGLTGSGYLRKLEDLNRHIVKKLNIYPAIDYELHVPMPVKKSLLVKLGRPKVMWRSEYGNLFIDPKTTVETIDVKFYDNNTMKFKNVRISEQVLPFFSTDDNSFKAVFETIRDMYPMPSKFEG